MCISKGSFQQPRLQRTHTHTLHPRIAVSYIGIYRKREYSFSHNNHLRVAIAYMRLRARGVLYCVHSFIDHTLNVCVLWRYKYRCICDSQMRCDFKNVCSFPIPGKLFEVYWATEGFLMVIHVKILSFYIFVCVNYENFQN